MCFLNAVIPFCCLFTEDFISSEISSPWNLKGETLAGSAHELFTNGRSIVSTNETRKQSQNCSQTICGQFAADPVHVCIKILKLEMMFEEDLLLALNNERK